MSILDLLGGLGRAGASVGGAVGGAVGKAGGAVGKAGGAVGGAVGGNLGVLANIGKQLPVLREEMIDMDLKEANNSFSRDFYLAIEDGNMSRASGLIKTQGPNVSPKVLREAEKTFYNFKDDAGREQRDNWKWQLKVVGELKTIHPKLAYTEMLRLVDSPGSYFWHRIAGGFKDPDGPEARNAINKEKEMLYGFIKSSNTTEDAKANMTEARAAAARYKADQERVTTEKMKREARKREEEDELRNTARDLEEAGQHAEAATIYFKIGDRFNAWRLMPDKYSRQEDETRFDMEMDLRKEFLRRNAAFRIARDSYMRMLACLANPSAPADIAAIFNFMKILDQMSVVRESEFRQAAGAAGLVVKAQNILSRLEEGKLLGPERSKMRREFEQAAFDMMQTMFVGYSKDIKRHSEIAESFGINKTFTFTDELPDLVLLFQLRDQLFDPDEGKKNQAWNTLSPGTKQMLLEADLIAKGQLKEASAGVMNVDTINKTFLELLKSGSDWKRPPVTPNKQHDPKESAYTNPPEDALPKSVLNWMLSPTGKP